MHTSYLASKRVSKSQQEDLIIQGAIDILEKRIFLRGPLLTSFDIVKDYLKLKLAPYKNEAFAVIFLDSKHRVISFEVVFTGTINASTVFPRPILQKALEHNCAAVIFAHNHPSGDVSPSEKDKTLTIILSDILEQIDVRVLDHFIVGSGDIFSFKESGLI